MKRKIVYYFVSIAALSALLAGCKGNDNKASNEYVTIEGYRGIEVDEVMDISEVTDEDVENYINSVLMQNSIEVTDRGAELGDVVDINYAGTVDGQEFDGGNAENFSLQLGLGQFLEGFDEGLIGHIAGDVYEWGGVLPENYAYNPELSGREVVYTITVNAITRPAELTDEFVQTISESAETVEEYRAEVRKMLEDNMSVDSNSMLQDAVWNAVLEKAEVEKYPEEEIKEISDSLIQQYKDMAESSEMDYETYVQAQIGITAEEFEKQAEEAAKVELKQRLVADVIAEEEKLLPKGDELEKEYQKLADLYGYQDVDALKEMVDEDSLKELVIQNLVKEWLTDNCKQDSNE